MAEIPFEKMHGAGNDFLVLDERAQALELSPTRVMALADRRRGVGCDQVIVLRRSDRADLAMRIFNPDGSEAGACGNATRCVAALECGRLGRRAVVVETPGGLLPAWLDDDSVAVDMGPPAFGWQDVPLAHACDTLHVPLAGGPAALSMGNPHATLFVEDLDLVDVAGTGAALERDPLFPGRANIGFAQIVAPDSVRLRVWERGAGLTLACGSGACAALVNAHRRGLSGRRATLHLDGGTLLIEWREADGHVLMTGPCATAFHGRLDLATYPA